MENKKEKQILNIIKFTPPLFIIIASILITLFLYFENKNTFKIEKSKIENKYIQENKIKIKEEVDKVHSFIKLIQKNTEQELKDSIKQRVYEAHSIANSLYEKYKDTKSKEEIFEMIKTSLREVRFNDGRGYFFFDDINGTKLFYPISKEIENKNLLNFTDSNGYKFMEKIIQTIKDKNETFDQYYWYKPNDQNKTYRKISFYKYFEPYNIVIGTGEYFDDYENITKQKILQYINLIRYGKTGYIFVIDYNGTYLSHFRKEYIGKSAIENNDTKSIEKVINALIDISKNGEGYYSYIQNKKIDTKIATKKISYVKGLNEWDWMIGTGFYEDEMILNIENKKNELNDKFDKYAQDILVVSFLLTIILLLVSIYISKLLETKFNEYKKDIKHQQNMLAQQSKMAAMGEMIGNIAHQWRQPLSTITTASTGIALQKELNILSDEQLYESTKKINDSAQYLSKTIDDFRNFFSPNKEKTTFLIKRTFEKTLNLLEAQFHSKDIDIITNIEDLELYTIENELIQALINILNNAKDELIKLESEHKKLIFINVRSENKKVIISINDNAGGVPLENIDRIFEPYFTTKHKSQGTGIGLYMTEEIIVKHLEGLIFVENKNFIYEDKSYTGALFSIVLPVS
ncbi:MAG: cache domain-containing protein [Poseidonibacter sp.]|uniref:sensor histidine kinase n=1 Tax=Poseidonibacter sp. TaxID=2321188 RepID=UPI00359F04CA